MRFHRVLATSAFATSLVALALSLSGILRAQKPEVPEVLHGPQGITEVGFMDGAPYRIDIPPDWNHSLVIYYHGYTQGPSNFPIAQAINPQLQPIVDRHYAVAQSAYSEHGWALAQAYPETESLRKYFTKKYGPPAGTYVMGASMGGVLVTITLELNPKPYLGGLDLCGAVGPTTEAFERRFAWRAAFDHYFPGVMPTLVPSPPNFEITQAVRDRIAFALKSNPTAATQMRNLLDLRNDADLANDIAYFTFVIADMQKRAGGNPFDNRNVIYSGTNPANDTADAELNDKVQRYAANPQARAYLVQHFTPTGHLGRPMLAVHTLYDPLVPPSSLTLYAHEVEAAGAANNLVQQYVHREGHCNIPQTSIGHAFDELVLWTHGGARPTAGLLR
jgi:hypothetical protein